MQIPLDAILKDETNTQISGSVSFVETFVKLYFNSQHIFFQLSFQERSFFHFLCEHMRTTSNEILVDLTLKQKYIDHIFNAVGKTYKLSSIGNVLTKLISVKLLIKLGVKEFYRSIQNMLLRVQSSQGKGYYMTYCYPKTQAIQNFNHS